MARERNDGKKPVHQTPYPIGILDHLGKAIEAHVQLSTPPEPVEPEPQSIDLQGGQNYE